MRSELFFVVSRDWQVRRSHQITQTLQSNLERVRSRFISEELWTLGNASSEIKRMANYETLLVPRDTNTSKPIWLIPDAKVDIEYSRRIFTSDLDKLGICQNSDTRIMLFYDGFGPIIDGLPSQIYSEWFSKSQTIFVFLQHGYLPNTLKYITTILKIRVHRVFCHKKHPRTKVDSRKYLTFVFDRYSFFLAILSGSKFSNTKIIGNFNLISLPRDSNYDITHLFRRHAVVIFSTGSYKNANDSESREFEYVVQAICRSLDSNQECWIKLKSGELELMKESTRNLLQNLKIQLLPDDIRVRDLPSGTTVVSSSSSNVGLEALNADVKLVVYTLKGSQRNSLRRKYRSLGIPQFREVDSLNTLVNVKKNNSFINFFDREKFVEEIIKKLNGLK